MLELGPAAAWPGVANYPQVLKLATGAGSENVRLVRSADEALHWIDRLFDFELTSLDPNQFDRLSVRRIVGSVLRLLRHRQPPVQRRRSYEPQGGYVLFQEFLPDNAFDTRITVIGNRAFGFRRFNRPNDFRASGSGLLDYAADAVDPEFVRLGFLTARLLGAQSAAIDGLCRGNQPIVGEVSYTYVSSAVHACSGHWELDGDPESGDLRWVDGQIWPEEAQIEDFIPLVRSAWARKRDS